MSGINSPVSSNNIGMTDNSQNRYEGQVNLCKFRFDTIKQKDLKILFEVMMVNSENRTIADLDSLIKILMHIEPVKKINNVPSVFLMTRKMNINKFKAKQLIFEKSQQSEHLYIILNGKIALYKKASQYYDSDQVLFLTSGSCFGDIYRHRNNFMAIAIEQTLVAVLSTKENAKIPLQIQFDQQRILLELLQTDIFAPYKNKPQLLRQLGPYISLNKLPIGSFLIREGQMPKALFYISKGLVKKSYFLNNENCEQIQAKRYSEGDYCPKSLREPLTYNLITESICQIICIPKRVLKRMNSNIVNAQPQRETSQQLYNLMQEKKSWKKYRENLLQQVVCHARDNKHGFKFRGQF